MSPEKTILPTVQKMVDNPGMYLLTVPSGVVPLWSQGGKIYPVKLDDELSLDGFNCIKPLAGPLVPLPLHAETPIDPSCN
jgi:hypothetical protein